MVLLPTPPLPLATATTCFTKGSTLRSPPRSPLMGRTLTFTFTSSPKACFSWNFTASSMRLRLCIAGLLTSTMTVMVRSSMVTSFTRSSATMSFFRSGSITLLRASNKAFSVISMMVRIYRMKRCRN